MDSGRLQPAGSDTQIDSRLRHGDWRTFPKFHGLFTWSLSQRTRVSLDQRFITEGSCLCLLIPFSEDDLVNPLVFSKKPLLCRFCLATAHWFAPETSEGPASSCRTKVSWTSTFIFLEPSWLTCLEIPISPVIPCILPFGVCIQMCGWVVLVGHDHYSFGFIMKFAAEPLPWWFLLWGLPVIDATRYVYHPSSRQEPHDFFPASPSLHCYFSCLWDPLSTRSIRCLSWSFSGMISKPLFAVCDRAPAKPRPKLHFLSLTTL